MTNGEPGRLPTPGPSNCALAQYNHCVKASPTSMGGDVEER